MHIDNDIKLDFKDVLIRPKRSTLQSRSEVDISRAAKAFFVPKAEIAANGYDLSINRYKEVVHAEVAHRPPGEILEKLGQLEAEIQQGMKELEGMLK